MLADGTNSVALPPRNTTPLPPLAPSQSPAGGELGGTMVGLRLAAGGPLRSWLVQLLGPGYSMAATPTL